MTSLYCHSGFLGRKVVDVECFDWARLSIDDVVASDRYPEPAAEARSAPDATL